MPRWLGLTSPAMSSTVSGTTPSHRDRKIKLLFPDRPLGVWSRRVVVRCPAMRRTRYGRSFTRQFYTAVLHGSARTTPRIRAELQASQEATRVLAARYGLNPKTVQKWRKRTTTADQPMGPKRPRSTVLTEAEEAIVVEFRRRTLLPLDDVLGACARASPPSRAAACTPALCGTASRGCPKTRRAPPSAKPFPKPKTANWKWARAN